MQKKGTILSTVLFVMSVVVFAHHPIPLKSLVAMFSWTETTHDFGEIKKDLPVSYQFEFTNVGTGPLIIQDVKVGCGCTVADYSREPIPAGEKGFVKATYNAQKIGVFTKTVQISANTDGAPVTLKLIGRVVE